MQGGNMQFKIDTANLIKAGTIPVIVAAVGGALWLLGFGLGSIFSILFYAIALFAGYWYVNLVLKSGAKPSIVEVAVNAAILGLVVGLVYGIVELIAINISFGGALGVLGFSIGGVIGSAIQAAIGSAIGAAAWYAYKSGMIKTS
jgi:hypothetical protein